MLYQYYLYLGKLFWQGVYNRVYIIDPVYRSFRSLLNWIWQFECSSIHYKNKNSIVRYREITNYFIGKCKILLILKNIFSVDFLNICIGEIILCFCLKLNLVLTWLKEQYCFGIVYSIWKYVLASMWTSNCYHCIKKKSN